MREGGRGQPGQPAGGEKMDLLDPPAALVPREDVVVDATPEFGGVDESVLGRGVEFVEDAVRRLRRRLRLRLEQFGRPLLLPISC